MRRIIIHTMLMMGAALMLTGCGVADSRAPVPEFMRARASDPPPPEAPPDVKQLVRERLDSVFVAASNPRQVQVFAGTLVTAELKVSACGRCFPIRLS